jgi:hypothetical protein
VGRDLRFLLSSAQISATQRFFLFVKTRTRAARRVAFEINSLYNYTLPFKRNSHGLLNAELSDRDVGKIEAERFLVPIFSQSRQSVYFYYFFLSDLLLVCLLRKFCGRERSGSLGHLAVVLRNQQQGS